MMMMRYSLQCNSGILLEAPLRRIFLHMVAGLLRTCMLHFFFYDRTTPLLLSAAILTETLRIFKRNFKHIDLGPQFRFLSNSIIV